VGRHQCDLNHTQRQHQRAVLALGNKHHDLGIDPIKLVRLTVHRCQQLNHISTEFAQLPFNGTDGGFKIV
jgi:hypothetical protein